MTTPLERLLSGYYNSAPVSEANPGGMGDGGHVANFPAALADIATVADEVVVDAEAVAGAATFAEAAQLAAQAADEARDEAATIAAGRTLRQGDGPPAPALGRDGDFYIDRVAFAIFGPRTAGAWGDGLSLVGPPGASEVNLDNVLAAIGYTPENLAARGIANGYMPLGSDGKAETAYLPDAVLGSLRFQGAWDASTNVPAIPAATSSNRGRYYVVNVEGTTSISGITDWKIGDWLVSSGSAWQKIDNTDQVVSVAGLQGLISGAALRVALALNNLDNTSDAAKPVSVAQQAALDAKATIADTLLTIVGTAHTLMAADSGKVHRFTSAAAVTVTLPNSLPAGWNAIWRQVGAGAVTFTPAAGATRRNRNAHTKSAGQYAEGSIAVDLNGSGTAADYWLGGDTAA